MEGITAAELLRSAATAAAILALAGLVLTQLVLGERLDRTTRNWLLLVLLLALPGVVVLGAWETVLEETKTVASCGTCHVMEPFVEDLRRPGSATLAARHSRNGWIPREQCYQCHTTYGVHGTLAAKRDGFRHWLLYVTRTYETPIRYSGSYPNVNCTGCHAETPAFRAVAAHDALEPELTSDRVSCATCHGPPHPAPPDRARASGAGAGRTVPGTPYAHAPDR